MMDLQLERPLVFFDIESTGIQPQRDRIVELSVVKLFPDGTRDVVTRRFNPEMPIPAGASAVHGIYDEDVADAPPFSVVATNLERYLADCDLAGYNIVRFDVPMLQEEFCRAGVDFSLEGRRLIDAYNIFCKLYPRTLSAAYRFFCGKELEDAHSAEADTLATLAVFEGQLARHSELPRNLDELAAFCDMRDPNAIDESGRFKFQDGVPVVNFGKNQGRSLEEMATNDPGFLRWIVRSDFAEDVKKIASDALIGKFPAPRDSI